MPVRAFRSVIWSDSSLGDDRNGIVNIESCQGNEWRVGQEIGGVARQMLRNSVTDRVSPTSRARQNKW